MKSNLVLWIVVAALVAGGLFVFLRPAASPGEVSEVVETEMTEGITVELSEQSDLGQTGTATLVNNADGMLVVTLAMTGGVFPEPQPAHIHLGACPSPGAVSYPLTDVVDGMSVTTLSVSWEDLVATGEPQAINIHKSAAEASTYTACGDLPI